MTQRDTPRWEVIVRRTARLDIEADLLAQVVIMLGRQLAQEADQPSDARAENGGAS